MVTFKCVRGACPPVTALCTQAWCACTFRRYIRGEGTQSFKVEMERLDSGTRSAAAYECPDGDLVSS